MIRQITSARRSELERSPRARVKQKTEGEEGRSAEDVTVRG
jgi:hypothetical protein